VIALPDYSHTVEYCGSSDFHEDFINEEGIAITSVTARGRADIAMTIISVIIK
jgi:hypothetical protein